MGLAEGKDEDKDPTRLRELRRGWWRNEPGSQGECPSSLVVVIIFCHAISQTAEICAGHLKAPFTSW